MAARLGAIDWTTALAACLLSLLASVVACGSGDSDDPEAPKVGAAGQGGGGSSLPGAGGGSGGEAGGSTRDAGRDAAVEPDFDSLPWKTGEDVGFGVARKDSGNPMGESVFLGYAGYGVPLDAACAWVTALYHATLRDRGVRHVYAIQGPLDPSYSQLEIQNSKIAASLVAGIGSQAKFILAAGHSSGSFVAHELLGQLASGLDPGDATKGKIVYFDLDGGQSGLSAPIVERLRKAYFVAALDTLTGTYSPNQNAMLSAGSAYAASGGYWESDAGGSGCNPGAAWCVHVTLVTTSPHDKSTGLAVPDYSDFADRPVAHAYIDAKADEAGLLP